MFEVTVEQQFAAAHRLTNYKGNCRSLHGHNWKVQVTFQSQKLDDSGLAIDFRFATKLLKSVINLLDHQYLNEIPPFDRLNPSCENIAKTIFRQIHSLMENGNEKISAYLYSVRVWESDKAFVTYYGG